MSTILKALRKLEEEKRSEPESLEERLVGSVAGRVAVRSSRRSLGLGMLLGSVLAMGLVAAVLAIGPSLGGSGDALEVAPVAHSPSQASPAGRVEPVRPLVVQPRVESAPTPIAAPQKKLTLVSVPAPLAESVLPDEEPSRAREVVAPSRRSSPSRSARASEIARTPEPAAPVSAPSVATPVTPLATPVARTAATERGRFNSEIDSAAASQALPATPLARAVALEAARSPELFVSKTIWHPDPKKRFAFVEVAGRPVRQLAEGDVIEGYTIVDIGLSRIELTRAGVSSIRRVGGR